ncbi:ribonuclease kappa-B-like isoform X1 [Amphibalanus amphitrite]|uniref:ribonuclease kappa-B-like isoform X1 n=1 Tax=Amphibalanus amphitrite TaxID=1232801 RepID=UPI001C911F94|nr:ribonuclease kappa-B-like isoform X1 [Amphibalanus amphitrite]
MCVVALLEEPFRVGHFLPQDLKMPLCGPKCSLCGLIVSVWGIIQLSIMGGLFMWNSIGLIEDLGLEEHYDTTEELYKAADDAYSSIAYNCWIAAAIYLVTLVISMQQFHVNKQAGHFQL